METRLWIYYKGAVNELSVQDMLRIWVKSDYTQLQSSFAVI